MNMNMLQLNAKRASQHISAFDVISTLCAL